MTRKELIKAGARVLAGMVAVTTAFCALSFFVGTESVEAAVLSANALVSEADTENAGYSYESSFRNEILWACAKMDGVRYEWGGGGWNGIDCAGSVSIAYSAALGTVWIAGTSGTYGDRTLSYSGGGAPDKYGFYWPGYAGIKSSFTNDLLKRRGITPSENYFSSFETNGTTGIQSEEWLDIIDDYGFLPGDMILWWNDSNDSENAQHITIYAGIENGVPMHWTASSTAGYFCKKPLSESSAEAGKGSFTGFMGLKATGLKDSAYVGFSLDKRDPSGINYTGAVFSFYEDAALNTKIGELRDDDDDGVYSDYYVLEDGSYSESRMSLTRADSKNSLYEDTIYIKETTCPTGLILPDGSGFSLEEPGGTVPDIYDFTDDEVYVLDVEFNETGVLNGELEYSISTQNGDVLYSESIDGYEYKYGSDVIIITNMHTTDSTCGRGKGAGLFTEAASISLTKTTSTDFDVTTTVFTLDEAGKTVATYRYSDGSWSWFDAYGRKYEESDFPIKYGHEYSITEVFAKGEPFKCIDGSQIEYQYSNDSGWEKIDDTSYRYSFTVGNIDSGETYDVSCENNKVSGRIKIEKTVADEDDSKSGFSFELWNADKTKKLADGISGDDGNVYWETGSVNRQAFFELPTGDYVLVELTPSKFYNGSTAEYVYKIPEGFTEDEDGNWYKSITIEPDTYSESITNDRNESSIRVEKESEDNMVENVEFSLFYGGKKAEPIWQENCINSGYTDADGVLCFEHLPEGWYRIDEKVMPAYKTVWEDGSEGGSYSIMITSEDDQKTITVSVCNELDVNPVISTELADDDMSHDISCGRNVTLTDRVHYSNLISGYEYEITGCLIDRESGEVLLDREGNAYTESYTFTANGTAGIVSIDSKGREVVEGDLRVEFVIDSAFLYENVFEQSNTSLSVVCYEYLKLNGVLIAEHCDIEDDKQTVCIAPSIRTTATDTATDTGVLSLSETVNVNDRVSFENLATGETYVVTGTLIDRSTGKPYLDSDGNSYKKQIEFVPGSPNGYVDVGFEDVSVPIEPIELVVFETLRVRNDIRPIAVHEDINDKDQTLSRASCNTYATTLRGDKAFLKNSTVTIVDHVNYENLEAGHTYYAKAALFKSDGTGVVSHGNNVFAIQEFVPEQESGTVDVSIKFNSSELESGDRVVVTENIFDVSTEAEIEQGIQLADVQVLTHEDLNNMDQSLSVSAIPMSGELLSNETVFGIVLFGSAVAAFASFAIYEKHRKRSVR